MSRLLEPIAPHRHAETNYLEKVPSKSWVSVDPRSLNTDHLRYTVSDSHRVYGRGQRRNANATDYEGHVPEGHERENLDLLEMMRNHTNGRTTKSSGHVLRSHNRKIN